MPDADAGRPEIEPRNIHFEFDGGLPVDWHSGEPAISHFYDALSLTFPEGERFFIDSVRNFAHRIADPDLKKRVQGFTAQEAIHSREHASYNALLTKHGIDVTGFESLMRKAMRLSQRFLPAKMQLAITCAYESARVLVEIGLLEIVDRGSSGTRSRRASTRPSPSMSTGPSPPDLPDGFAVSSPCRSQASIS